MFFGFLGYVNFGYFLIFFYILQEDIRFLENVEFFSIVYKQVVYKFSEIYLKSVIQDLEVGCKNRERVQ